VVMAAKWEESTVLVKWCIVVCCVVGHFGCSSSPVIPAENFSLAPQ